MNSKKTKHKNRPNKTPNPNPPQKFDTNTKPDDKTEDLQEESAIKNNERVPEIESEVMTPPVIELQEFEVDSPKKPKRSKGKKKKQDNVGDSLDEKATETIKDEVSIHDESENKAIDATNITPNIRKKKNKKKPNEERTEESMLKDFPEEIQTVQIISTETTEELSSQIEKAKEEIKPLKKKGKKKKQRSDSERSEKSEDNICSATFQQLLGVNVEILDESKKTEHGQTLKKDSVKSKPADSDDQLEINNEINMLKKSDEVVLAELAEEIPIVDIQQGEEKQKDKKHPLKEQTKEQNADLQNVEEMNVIEHILPGKSVDIVSTGSVIFEETKQNIKLENSLESSELKTSPKPKPKIAKPVEKKRKPKQEILCEESSSHVMKLSEALMHDEKAEEIVFEAIKIQGVQEEKIMTGNIADTIDMEGNSKKNESHTNNLLEHINAPYPVMGKKKKRIPLVPIDTDVTLQTPETKQSVKLHTTEIVDVLAEKILPMSQESINIESQQTLDDHLDITFESPLNPATDLKDATLQVKSVPNFPQQEQDKILSSEIKMGKKKKKTHKIPDQANHKTEVEMTAKTTEPDILQTYSTEEHTAQANKKESNNLVDLTIVDIEISSMKTEESEGSGCDITPYIHYPRAISQQLIDDNNNMVIQEIIGVEEIKSNISLVISDMPIVEGSGETPIITPEFVASGIRVTEIETNTPTEKEEKTDLKSKMMEVNQDMEELKLSIERSLAEFTALEKREKDIEIQLKDAGPKFDEYVSKDENKIADSEDKKIEVPITESEVLTQCPILAETPPICPARKDHKGKGKSKKKGKQDTNIQTAQNRTTAIDHKEAPQGDKKEEKTEKTDQKTDTTKEKGKQQSSTVVEHDNALISGTEESFDNSLDPFNYEPIDNFEDALTSSVDDVNKTFEMIANEVYEANKLSQQQLAANKPEINVIAPVEDTATVKGKKNPISPPKNLLGHPDIPVPSNKTDYKKEKNKTPNTKQAKVKIKDSVDVEAPKQSKESQTDNKKNKKDQDKAVKESFAHITNVNEEYVYKYSFRKVFLQSACHVCKKDLGQVRVPCNFCNLVFYCSLKHKDEDWPQHQALCFAVSTIVHLKDQKHIYADAKNVTGHNYRLIRMQMILSCEKVLKRRLVPWEQEALLYPRICADVTCREWRQSKLNDCEGCGQISFCSNKPEHLPKSHQRWCKSYFLYQKLVSYQQTKGRLESKLPSRVMAEQFVIPGKINEVLASMYEEKIDMNDIQYAALTQLATAPLTAAYCDQIYRNILNTHINGICKKTSFTIHVVGAELQFEADVLNKWEVFFLHLRPDVKELRVVLISPALNPSNLPLDLLAKIKLCDNCRQNKRRVLFDFQDKKNYYEYKSCEEFISPDIVCAFNASIQRSSICNGKDPWPSTINSILKLKTPFVITSNTMTELRRDLQRIAECARVDYNVISEPIENTFASVRPDRNFISDDEMPLLFKNYCFAVVCGV